MRQVLEREVLPQAYAACEVRAAGLNEPIGTYARLAVADLLAAPARDAT
ncbi:MAG: hypothetical protein OWU84_00165 [Firmicutes bacterium]|nr:hypothetical protein [Bacillota bacterium]